MDREENPTPKRENAWQEGFAGSGNHDDEIAMIKDIVGMDDLRQATSLRIVVNSKNGVSLAHLGRNLPNLVELNLSMSLMESIRDIGTGFHFLQVLWVPRCSLDSFDGISALPTLRELYASYNDIADLQPLADCPDLEVLDMECNQVENLDALEMLSSGCPALQSLNLSGCPVTNIEGYKGLVLQAVPTLTSLDDTPIDKRADGTRAATGPATYSPPKLSLFDSEMHLVQEGIKHARVGVDSHEFRELEIAMMVASSPSANPPHLPLGGDDEADPSNDARSQLTIQQLTAVASSSILPASAGSWMRCSQQGSLPGMTSFVLEQQQHKERADCPSINSSGIDSRASTASIGSRPSSLLFSATGAGEGVVVARSSSSSLQRPATNTRPFSARPNACVSNGRPPTASSSLIGGPVGSSAPPTAGGGGGQMGGLYWRKNRVNAVGNSSAGPLKGGRNSGRDEDEEDAASSLTFGGEAALVGGGLARDLRRRRNPLTGGLVNRGPSPPSSQGPLLDTLPQPISQNGSSGGEQRGSATRRSCPDEEEGSARVNQEKQEQRTSSLSVSFDSQALLQELRRWKVETADVALTPTEDEEGGLSGVGISEAWQGEVDDTESAKADVLNFDSERSSPTFENLDQPNISSSKEMSSGIKLSSIHTKQIVPGQVIPGPSLRPSSALGRPPLSPIGAPMPSLSSRMAGSFKPLDTDDRGKLSRPSTPSRNGTIVGLAPVLGARPARPSKMLICKVILDAFPGRVVCKTSSSAAVWDQAGDQVDMIKSLLLKSTSLRGGREVDLSTLNPACRYDDMMNRAGSDSEDLDWL